MQDDERIQPLGSRREAMRPRRHEDHLHRPDCEQRLRAADRERRRALGPQPFESGIKSREKRGCAPTLIDQGERVAV